MGDTGAGPAVLLLHGQPGSARDWAGVERRLTDNRLLVPDRPGYGASPGPALGPLDSAEALAVELKARVSGPVTVVGHSYGGAVGVALAERYPEQVSALVLLAPAVTPACIGYLDRVLAAPWVGDGLAWAAVGILGRVARRRRDWSWRSFVTEQRALLEEVGYLSAGLESISVPSVVVSGAHDRVVPSRATAEVVFRIPGAELIEIARAGHLLMLDAPDRVVEVIRTYAR